MQLMMVWVTFHRIVRSQSVPYFQKPPQDYLNMMQIPQAWNLIPALFLR